LRRAHRGRHGDLLREVRRRASGPDASARFERLLDACDAFAGAEQARTLVAGVNMARDEAYGIMLARGFRTFIQGVAMQKPNDAGFNRPDAFVIADWR
jgi:hypothetical protein